MAKTILITGISASGKSTLGARLQTNLVGKGLDCVKLLDGESIRKTLSQSGKHYGYTMEDRHKVALEIAEMASELNKNGINCIICTIAHMRKTRMQMRTIVGDVMEIYLDCPINICAERDYKDQYAMAFKGSLDNFVGVTEPYQKSKFVDHILYTGKDTIERCSQELFELAIEYFQYSKTD